VTLARVLAQQTPILFLDEPTSALDLRHQQMTMQIMRKKTAAGATVIAVLHDLNLAAMYADRVAMIHQSRLEFLGTPDDAFTPDNIKTVFGLNVEVMTHPTHDCPLIVPLATDGPLFKRPEIDVAVDRISWVGQAVTNGLRLG
jgi:iron complex transport system ATP-binding protein